MTGIREQSHGIGPDTEGRLNEDEAQVQDDADGEGAAMTVRGSVAVMMGMSVRMRMRLHDVTGVYSLTAFTPTVSRLNAAAKSALV